MFHVVIFDLLELFAHPNIPTEGSEKRNNKSANRSEQPHESGVTIHEKSTATHRRF